MRREGFLIDDYRQGLKLRRLSRQDQIVISKEPPKVRLCLGRPPGCNLFGGRAIDASTPAQRICAESLMGDHGIQAVRVFVKTLTKGRQLVGFTLVELLVTIGVIAMLIGLLFPAIGRSKERSRMSQCVSNLRQIGYGLKVYAADFDQYPSAITKDENGRTINLTAGIGGHNGTAVGQIGLEAIPTAEHRPLYNYIKSMELFRCPVDSGEAIRSQPFMPTLFASVGTSYLGSSLFSVAGIAG